MKKARFHTRYAKDGRRYITAFIECKSTEEKNTLIKACKRLETQIPLWDYGFCGIKDGWEVDITFKKLHSDVINEEIANCIKKIFKEAQKIKEEIEKNKI